MEDIYQDETRINFICSFLNEYYSFKSPIISIADDIYRINIETMIYTHIWESNLFLKRLYKLAVLCSFEDYTYPWTVNIPDMGRSDFIRNQIKEKYTNADIPLKELIEKAYHSSLRNAFAHSAFSIDERNKKMELYNYKGKDWELKNILLDDWSERFVYSFLLSYRMYDIVQKYRKNIVNYMGTDSLFGLYFY